MPRPHFALNLRLVFLLQLFGMQPLGFMLPTRPRERSDREARWPLAAIARKSTGLGVETVSSKILSHPALRSASVCKAVSCSAVDTRA